MRSGGTGYGDEHDDDDGDEDEDDDEDEGDEDTMDDAIRLGTGSDGTGNADR
jgi:hypothetical protein